jgi:hypothetical protein
MIRYILYLGAYKEIMNPMGIQKICLDAKDYEYIELPNLDKEIEWFKKEYPQATFIDYKLEKIEILKEGKVYL